MSGRKLDSKDCNALAHAPFEKLNLNDNYIENEGVMALVNGNAIFMFLDLRRNLISDKDLPWPEGWWELYPVHPKDRVFAPLEGKLSSSSSSSFQIESSQSPLNKSHRYGGGVMYRYNPEVQENDPKALEWLTYAANHGHKGAIDYLKQMGKLPDLGSDLVNYGYPNLILRGITDEVTKQNQEVYQRFLNGALIYTDPKIKSKITLPIRDLPNPLEGTFDLSRCGDTGKYLSIATGYRKGKKAENKDKIEVWFAPRFLIEKELNGAAAHFKPIMANWKNEAPVGIFWTWGNDDLKYYDYLTTKSIGDLSKNDLYDNWHEDGEGDWAGVALAGRDTRAATQRLHVTFFP